MFPGWLTEWIIAQNIPLWGAADLRDSSTPQDEKGATFPFGLSLIFPLNPQIMAGIRCGPNQPYADEYAIWNFHLDDRWKKIYVAIVCAV